MWCISDMKYEICVVEILTKCNVRWSSIVLKVISTIWNIFSQSYYPGMRLLATKWLPTDYNKIVFYSRRFPLFITKLTFCVRMIQWKFSMQLLSEIFTYRQKLSSKVDRSPRTRDLFAILVTQYFCDKYRSTVYRTSEFSMSYYICMTSNTSG